VIALNLLFLLVFDIADKFLKMVDNVEAALHVKTQEVIEEDKSLDQLAARIDNKHLVEGNDTKH